MKTSVIRTMITYIVLISLLAFAPGLAKWVEPGDIENTVKKELHGYEEKLIVFKEMFLNLHGLCEVRYGKTCFFFMATGAGGGTLNFEAARLMCEKRNALLGNVYSKEHFQLLSKRARRYIGATKNNGNVIGIRTGMTCDPKSQIVYLSDGSLAPYTRWAASYPLADQHRTGINILAYREQEKSRDGYENVERESAHFGALCEITL